MCPVILPVSAMTAAAFLKPTIAKGEECFKSMIPPLGNSAPTSSGAKGTTGPAATPLAIQSPFLAKGWS